MMLAKKHESSSGDILAVCDKKHLGKTFEDDKHDFTVNEKFYGGEEINEKEFIEKLKYVNSANLFGDVCVEIAEKEGLIKKESIINICGIKHAQLYLV